MTKTVALTLALVAGLIVLGVVIARVDAPPPRPSAAAAPIVTPAPAAPATVTTARGVFSVPGQARLDGAGEVASINIWDTVQRHRIVCALPDHAAIELLDSNERYDERRFYFHVKGGSTCEGWVPESFVVVR